VVRVAVWVLWGGSELRDKQHCGCRAKGSVEWHVVSITQGPLGGRWVSQCGQQRGCQGESDRSHGAGSSKNAGEVAVWYVCGEQLQCMCVWGALVEQCGVDRSAYVKRDDEA
jgi:hypothetical protein